MSAGLQYFLFRGFSLMLGAFSIAVISSCSLSNVEGPDVRCEDLQCGRVNACENGIIASCGDGKTMKFHVCTEEAKDICGESWQKKGQFKCDQYDIECEGCRPERVGGCAGISGSSSSSGGTGGSSSTGN